MSNLGAFGFPQTMEGGGGGLAKIKIDYFDTTGVYYWSLPLWAIYLEITLIAGGGGGGSGRRGAATSIRCGGGAGGGGGFSYCWLMALDLQAEMQCTIGAGGAGGLAISADSTSGNPGSIGADTIFGPPTSGWGNPALPVSQMAYARATAGNFGAGGTAASGTGGAVPTGSILSGGGGAASTTGLAGNSGGAVLAGCSGGGAGGGISSGDLESAGGGGGILQLSGNYGLPNFGAIGTAGTSVLVPRGRGGMGGGGGGSSKTGAAGAGAAGFAGSGGGGGGASLNATGASGAGGKGGDGQMMIVCHGYA